MAQVVTVLRSGGDFKPWHVQAMQAQVKRWAPEGTKFTCLSDVYIEGVECIQLEHDWPGWWAKIELFRPELDLDGALYTDLDNVIVGPIEDILNQPGTILNSGVKGTAWTALAKFSHTARSDLWETFRSYEFGYLFSKFEPPGCPPPFGDAGFVDAVLGRTASRWENLFENQVVNISTMQTPFGFRVPSPKPRIVLCHHPHRPWTLPIFQGLYGENL